MKKVHKAMRRDRWRIVTGYHFVVDDKPGVLVPFDQWNETCTGRPWDVVEYDDGWRDTPEEAIEEVKRNMKQHYDAQLAAMVKEATGGVAVKIMDY